MIRSRLCTGILLGLAVMPGASKTDAASRFPRLVHTTSTGLPQPASGVRSIVIHGDSLSACDWSASGNQWPNQLWHNWDAPIVSQAIGGTTSEDAVSRAIVLLLSTPVPGQPLRALRHKSAREDHTGFRADWFRMAAIYDEIRYVEFYIDGERVAITDRPTTRTVTTDHAAHHTRLYCDPTGLTAGQRVYFDSDDDEPLPQDLMRGNPEDRIGPSAAGNYTREGFPLDLVYRRQYTIQSVGADYVTISELPGGAALDLGGNATVNLLMVLGWDGPVYTGGEATIQVRRARDNWTHIVFLGTNDWGWDYAVTPMEGLRLMRSLPQPVRVLMVSGYMNAWPTFGPGSVKSEGFQASLRLGKAYYGDNFLDLYTILCQDERHASEIALLDDPAVPQLLQLGGTPEAPVRLAAWDGVTPLDDKDRNNGWGWVGPGYMPLKYAFSIGGATAPAVNFDRLHGNTLMRTRVKERIRSKLLELGF